MTYWMDKTFESIYGIGAGVVTGVVYNLALSRNPMKLAFSTYGLVTFGYYFQCRYHYRKNELEMKKISHAFSQAPFLEGTAADQEWREKANLQMPEKKED